MLLTYLLTAAAAAAAAATATATTTTTVCLTGLLFWGYSTSGQSPKLLEHE